MNHIASQKNDSLKKIRLVVLASGSGTNAENIIRYFQGHAGIVVTHVLSNKEDAGVHVRAENLGVSSDSFSRTEFMSEQGVLGFLKSNADFVILAGFLWKVPASIVDAFSDRIINIHPALLPKYGGKGMYGKHVHRAVIDNNESSSGITIHLVNEIYDDGAILFQASTDVEPGDTPEALAEKIHKLEYEHFPKVIEQYIENYGS